MLALRRDRLLKRTRALRPRLIVLVAPAGFGKTFLVRELLNEFDRGAFVDCALPDNASMLARLVSIALAELSGRGSDVAREQLSTTADSAAAITLAEDLWRRLDGPGAIAFENAELAFQDQGMREFLQRLMRTPGERRTVIVASRRSLPQGFAGRLGPHEIVTIGQDDLRFSRSEVAELLAFLGLSGSQTDRLHNVSRGWVLALRVFEHVVLDREIDSAIDALERLDTDTMQEYVIAHILPALDDEASKP